MFYIKRGPDKKILSITTLYDEKLEALPFSNPEVRDFFSRDSKIENVDFINSDIDFVRVLEDLIEILVNRELINLSEFPQNALEKLLRRKAFRGQESNFIDLDVNGKFKFTKESQ